MGYVLKAVLSSAQHPEYGQITVPFPIPDEKYDRMIELLEPLEIGDALRQDCRVDELDSFYTVLNRLVGSLVNFDELDYLAKRLDSFDDGEAAQFQGMACKLGVSNIKDFINLTFCCQQATVITDFSDLDAIGRQHYMTMQGGGCRIEELERLDGRKFALDLILNHLEGRITPYGVVYDNVTVNPETPDASTNTDDGNGADFTGTEQTIQPDPVKPEYTEDELKDPTKTPDGTPVEGTPEPQDHNNVTPPPEQPSTNTSGGLPGFDNVPNAGANQGGSIDSDGDINTQVGIMG